jgi:hypothetical protein
MLAWISVFLLNELSFYYINDDDCNVKKTSTNFLMGIAFCGIRLMGVVIHF